MALIPRQKEGYAMKTFRVKIPSYKRKMNGVRCVATGYIIKSTKQDKVRSTVEAGVPYFKFHLSPA